LNGSGLNAIADVNSLVVIAAVISQNSVCVAQQRHSSGIGMRD
jgi:hypothetical protein